jgi:elongator complex protein 3
MKEALKIFKEIEKKKKWDENSLQRILRKYPKEGKGLYRHDELVATYKDLIKKGEVKENKVIKDRIRLKPTRTQSGVAIVTVLMKPYPCPGKCIFCPNESNMPKSYIASEPGAQRALTYNFDPYDQTKYRIKALRDTGHNTDKIELIVLGGTCSTYPENYQIWFIKRCFDAMNSFDDTFKEKNIPEDNITWEDLFKVQQFNETAKCRNVGLVLETRPDFITKNEIIRMRKLGATKIQIGVQSLNDEILEKNRRGHTVQETKEAFRLLRTAGFKIHAHIMPNLYGSNIKQDIEDYKTLWTEDFYPDELKIYPTSIIPNTYLEELYNRGEYEPYSKGQLLEYFVNTLPNTPRFVRLTRIIRDIPSDEIVAGNMASNFRQIAEGKIEELGLEIEDIRSREIKGEEITWDDIEEEVVKYDTSVSIEYFVSYITKKDCKICGFLRLSIPKKNISKNNFIEELRDSSIIREVHVYGTLVNIGKDSKGQPQHLGLGKRLIEKSEVISRENGFKKISVISAIGTREYYEKRGFGRGELYMNKSLPKGIIQPW